MEKSRKRKKANVPPALASEGWKKVDVGDELLLGSEEGGFLELEEFAPAVIASQSAAAGIADEASKQTATGAASAAKPKSKKRRSKTDDPSEHGAKEASILGKADKKGKKDAAQHAGAPADVEGLKAKIAALQQENAALKYAVSLTSWGVVCSHRMENSEPQDHPLMHACAYGS